MIDVGLDSYVYTTLRREPPAVLHRVGHQLARHERNGAGQFMRDHAVGQPGSHESSGDARTPTRGGQPQLVGDADSRVTAIITKSCSDTRRRDDLLVQLDFPS